VATISVISCCRPEHAIEALRAKGWRFYTFIGSGGARFMCSWDTEEERVRELAADIRMIITG
jgi:threonine aldolase